VIEITGKLRGKNLQLAIGRSHIFRSELISLSEASVEHGIGDCIGYPLL
jgi:hypothetical protein